MGEEALNLARPIGPVPKQLPPFFAQSRVRKLQRFLFEAQTCFTAPKSALSNALPWHFEAVRPKKDTL